MSESKNEYEDEFVTRRKSIQLTELLGEKADAFLQEVYDIVVAPMNSILKDRPEAYAHEDDSVSNPLPLEPSETAHGKVFSVGKTSYNVFIRWRYHDFISCDITKDENSYRLSLRFALLLSLTPHSAAYLVWPLIAELGLPVYRNTIAGTLENKFKVATIGECRVDFTKVSTGPDCASLNVTVEFLITKVEPSEGS